MRDCQRLARFSANQPSVVSSCFDTFINFFPEDTKSCITLIGSVQNCIPHTCANICSRTTPYGWVGLTEPLRHWALSVFFLFVFGEMTGKWFLFPFLKHWLLSPTPPPTSHHLKWFWFWPEEFFRWEDHDLNCSFLGGIDYFYNPQLFEINQTCQWLHPF